MKSNKKKDPIIVHNDRGESIRLNKYISESGFCSRREADKFIESGKVTVDGVKAVMGTKVQKGQKVRVNGKLISKVEEMVYIVLNKPVGITCTTEHKVRGNIVDFVNHEKRIFPVGRLDKDSEGLIILTNDGDIVNKILRAGNNHEKEYIVVSKFTDLNSSMKEKIKLVAKHNYPFAVSEILNEYLMGYILPYEKLKAGLLSDITSIFTKVSYPDEYNNVKIKPEGLYASIFTPKGYHVNYKNTIKKLFNFIDLNSLEIVGDLYIEQLRNYWSTESSQQYVTKIMIPVDYK